MAGSELPDRGRAAASGRAEMCIRDRFVDSELVQVLQAIRDHFGAPVVITSGYRTAAHNLSLIHI